MPPLDVAEFCPLPSHRAPAAARHRVRRDAGDADAVVLRGGDRAGYVRAMAVASSGVVVVVDAVVAAEAWPARSGCWSIHARVDHRDGPFGAGAVVSMPRESPAAPGSPGRSHRRCLAGVLERRERRGGIGSAATGRWRARHRRAVGLRSRTASETSRGSAAITSVLDSDSVSTSAHRHQLGFLHARRR